MLLINDLHKNFGGLIVTDGVTLDIGQGELHAVIGPNGAGKTTLINQISGLIAPTAGTINFNGVDITGMPADQRAARGLARSFQITSVLPGFSALENVALAVQAHAGTSYRFLAARTAIKPSTTPRTPPSLKSGWPSADRSSPPIYRMARNVHSSLRSRWPWGRNCFCWMSRWPAPDARKAKDLSMCCGD